MSPETRKKKLEKEAKQKQQEAEKAAKMREVERKKEIRTAFQVLGKIAHVEGLEKATKDKCWSMVPDWAKKQATDVLEKAREMHANAIAVTKDKKDVVKLTMSLEEAAMGGGRAWGPQGPRPMLQGPGAQARGHGPQAPGPRAPGMDSRGHAPHCRRPTSTSWPGPCRRTCSRS